MALRVALVKYDHRRSIKTLSAMAEGIAKTGDQPFILSDIEYRTPEHDVAVFWGYVSSMQRVLRTYTEAGKPAIYIDFGYWGRDKENTHYKLSLNARHPTAYFRSRQHDNKRAKALGIEAQKWRKAGSHIVVAGMGAKAAWAERLEPPGSWETRVIAQLKTLTDRPIVYRPKPSWRDAEPLKDAAYSPPEQPLEDVLANAHAVVTHHSNVAVDALVSGVPAFVWDGVASPMGLQDLALIETPLLPRDRESWINDISYTQFTLSEMAEGLPWRHLKNEGLLG